MSTSTIQGKIRFAKALFASHGREILADAFFQKLLAEYRKAIENTQQLMRDYGVVICCSGCAAKEPAGCCAKGVEDWYDEYLLFINLIMGGTIDNRKESGEACLFVGVNGCELIARYSFCVNFLCPTIVSSLGPARTQELLSVSGAELFAEWNLERELRRWVRDKAVR